MIQKFNLTIANSYLIQADKPIIVDTGAPSSGERILKMAKKYDIHPSDIGLILLTHAHSDHAGSALELCELTGAPIAVHEADVAMLERGNNGTMLPIGMEARFSQPFVDKPFPAVTPDIVFTHMEDLAEFNIPAKLLHTPGHTEGSISLIFDNGDAIIGDVLRGELWAVHSSQNRLVTPISYMITRIKPSYTKA